MPKFLALLTASNERTFANKGKSKTSSEAGSSSGDNGDLTLQTHGDQIDFGDTLAQVGASSPTRLFFLPIRFVRSALSIVSLLYFLKRLLNFFLLDSHTYRPINLFDADNINMADVPEPDYGEQEEPKQATPTPPPAEKPAPATSSSTASSAAIDAAVRFNP